MVELPADWRAFRDHIEGNEGPFSCAIINGQPHLHATAIQPNASPTLAPLADLLRSDAVIPTRNSRLACRYDYARHGQGVLVVYPTKPGAPTR